MSESPSVFHESLPRKRMAAGVVFINAAGQVLVVHPTYTESWELPGGVVEDGESPRSAARREVAEELALQIEPGPMICVDYNASTEDYVESLMFLFAGPRLTAADEAAIRLPPEELAGWRWCDLTEATALLPDRVALRLVACLRDDEFATGLYLEDQSVP